jgi:UDP-GlcNAc:undecaprenyl-phosphate GlcNAc-1-phosphate transferase
VQSVVALELSTLAAAVSLSIIPIMRRLAPHLGLVDLPDSRKVHTVPVPRVGGWGITLGMLAALLLWLKISPLLLSFALASLVLFVFGIWDDRKTIGHWTKFSGQLLAAVLIVCYGDLYIVRLPFLDAMALSPAIGRPLTVFALVGAINALNHSDGLDGLAAGESILTLIGLTILGYLSDNVVVTGIALATAGGIFGFLHYNSHPARVFMGDSGSQVLGLTLGFLTIYLTQTVNLALSAAVPLMLLGIPVADTLVVLFLRIRAGGSWFRATRNHTHHRLLDRGLSHYKTVIAIYSVHALLVVAAVVLRYASDLVVVSSYLLTVGCFFGGLMVAERRGWRAPPAAARRGGRAHTNTLLGEISGWMITVIVPAFMLLASLWVGHVPRDVGAVAAILVAIMLLALLIAGTLRSLLIRAAAYMAAIASAYLVVGYPGALVQRPFEIAVIALMAILLLATAAYIRLTSDEKFGTTPTDWLIVFVLVALSVLAGIDSDSLALVQTVVFTVVLLYSCEVLIGRAVKAWNGFNIATLATLAIIAARGLFITTS